ncbi:MAG TPA: hypothetical protein EYO60_08870 [Candidatus Lambdaproteobacteria bacterium]|nr:hypothetical protein [Candidatus Lambdaproteobacteria bacterium]
MLLDTRHRHNIVYRSPTLARVGAAGLKTNCFTKRQIHAATIAYDMQKQASLKVVCQSYKLDINAVTTISKNARGQRRIFPA